MRRGELLALRWRDFDLDAGRVSVRRSTGIVKVKGEGSRLIEGQPRPTNSELLIWIRKQWKRCVAIAWPERVSRFSWLVARRTCISASQHFTMNLVTGHYECSTLSIAPYDGPRLTIPCP